MCSRTVTIWCNSSSLQGICHSHSRDPSLHTGTGLMGSSQHWQQQDLVSDQTDQTQYELYETLWLITCLKLTIISFDSSISLNMPSSLLVKPPPHSVTNMSHYFNSFLRYCKFYLFKFCTTALIFRLTTGQFLSVDNLAMVSGSVICQVLEFCPVKVLIL